MESRLALTPARALQFYWRVPLACAPRRITARQPALTSRCRWTMQDVMQSMSGMQCPHSRCASPSQAARCSGVPWAAAGTDASANAHTTKEASTLGIRFRIPLCRGSELTNSEAHGSRWTRPANGGAYAERLLRGGIAVLVVHSPERRGEGRPA